MKDKADLVQGWLKKAFSDSIAMRASGRAGAPDAACFHAQQAVEKYLKAYLLDRDRAIIHSHNIQKLLSLCAEIDAAFDQFSDVAALLTPFAVEARYDTEFWPSADVMERAQDAANRVAEFVKARIQAVPGLSAAVYEAWHSARDRFNWRVDLRRFKDASEHPGFFDRVIEPQHIIDFELAFRRALVPDGPRERAAEVVYWKNYGNFRARDRITRDLLDWIPGQERWTHFADSIIELSATPNWDSFQRLIMHCGQTSGFATPLTFLAFYDPHRFPMVDRKIGHWWLRQFPHEPQFAWNPSKTVITPRKHSLEAYLAWTDFCRRRAMLLAASGTRPWRARDVEMAVWSDATLSPDE